MHRIDQVVLSVAVPPLRGALAIAGQPLAGSIPDHLTRTLHAQPVFAFTTHDGCLRDLPQAFL